MLPGPTLIDEAADLAALISNSNSNSALLVLLPMHGVHDKHQILKNRRTLEDKLLQ